MGPDGFSFNEFASRINTEPTAFIQGTLAIALLLYLPCWFNKRFPSTPKTHQYKLGEEVGTIEQDSAKLDRSTDEVIDQTKEPTVDDDYWVKNLRARIEVSKKAAYEHNWEFYDIAGHLNTDLDYGALGLDPKAYHEWNIEQMGSAQVKRNSIERSILILEKQLAKRIEAIESGKVTIEL